MGAFTKGKDKITDSSTITGGHRNSKKLIKIALILLVAIVITTGVVWAYFFVAKDSFQSSASCGEDQITRALAYNFDQGLEPGVSIINEIESQGNIESDLNCVYILALVNLKINHAENARKYVGIFETNFNENTVLSEQITQASASEGFTPLEWLKLVLQRNEEQNSNALNSNTNFTDPEELFEGDKSVIPQP